MNFITKGNNFLEPKGHVNEMGVSRLISMTPHMGFLTFSKSGFPSYMLDHEMETPTFRKLGFLATISLTHNYVPTKHSSLVNPPIMQCMKGCTFVKC